MHIYVVVYLSLDVPNDFNQLWLSLKWFNVVAIRVLETGVGYFKFILTEITFSTNPIYSGNSKIHQEFLSAQIM